MLKEDSVLSSKSERGVRPSLASCTSTEEEIGMTINSIVSKALLFTEFKDLTKSLLFAATYYIQLCRYSDIIYVYLEFSLTSLLNKINRNKKRRKGTLCFLLLLPHSSG